MSKQCLFCDNHADTKEHYSGLTRYSNDSSVFIPSVR